MRPTKFKMIASVTLLIATFALPEVASAKSVTATIQLKQFRGPPAYVALYLTKPDGEFHSTLAVRGGKAKYRRHLRGWFRGVSQNGGKVDGVSGASVGSGRSFTVQANIADALIKAGYQVRVDTSVEDLGDFAKDVVATLDTGKPEISASGKALVSSITISH